MSASHAPLPWHLSEPDSEGERVIYDANNECVTFNDGGPELKDAAFIVRAVNSHDELLAALKDVTECLSSQRDYQLNNAHDDDYSVVKKAVVAIAKAEGR